MPVQKILISLYCFITLATMPAWAAQGYTLRGKVLTPAHNAVANGTVKILTKNLDLIHTTQIMNGQFRINYLNLDTIWIEINSPGYKLYTQPYIKSNTDTLIIIDDIVLQNNTTLNTVTVKSKTPQFETNGLSTTVNVEKTSLSTAGSALDILRKSPGVLVTSNDDIQILGKGKPLIFLDGVQITSNEILKSITSAEIKKIEIIRNPSAKYDAQGAAIIEITTTKNTTQGFNGQLFQNTLYLKYIYSVSGIKLNINQKRWNSNFSYNMSNGQQWTSDRYLRLYKSNDSTLVSLKNNIYETQRCNQVHNYKLGCSYKLSAQSQAGFSFFGYYDRRTLLSLNQNEVMANQVWLYGIQTKTNQIPALLNNNFNLNYNHTLDTANSSITVSVQYGHFLAKQLSNIQQALIIPGYNSLLANKRGKNYNNISIKSAALHYTQYVNKKITIECGAKESYIDKASDIGLENDVNGLWTADNNYSNQFQFAENIAAIYSNLIGQYKKANVRLGARAEHTISKGKSILFANQNIDKKYINIFENFSLGYNFTKDLTASLAFTSRINRPTFQDLDPFINYIDSLTSFRGNPYLLPEYTQSVEAMLIYMKEANITLGYNKTKGAIRLVVDKVNNNSEAFTASSQNLAASHSYYASLTLPYELKWWTTSNYFGYFINEYAYQQQGVYLKNIQPTFSMYLYNELRLKEIISTEITYEYTSSAVDGIFITEPFSVFSISLKKQFLNKQLTCRVVANDIFSRYKTAGRSNIPLYNITFDSRMAMHYFLLALNYKFGKLSSQKTTYQSLNDDELKRIKVGK